MAAARLTRRLHADAARVFSAGILTTVAGIVAGIFVVRALGPVGKGAIAYVQTTLTLATTGFSGVAMAAILAISRGGADRRHTERVVLRRGLVLGGAGALVLAAVGTFVPSQRVLLGAAAALIPTLVAAGAVSMLQYRGQINRALLVQQGTTSVAMMAMAAAALLSGELGWTFAAWVLALAAAAIAGAALLRGAGAPSAPTASRASLHVEVTTTLTQVVAYLNLTIDVYIVAATRSPQELGIYTLAIGAGEMLWQLSRALVFPALGPIADLPRREAGELCARLTRHALLLVTGAAVLAWFAGPTLLQLVYGRQFAASGDLLRIVLPGIVAMAAEGPIGSYVYFSVGRPRDILVLQTISTLACAAICGAGLPRFGLAVAAAATSVTYCAFFVGIVILGVRYGFPLGRVFSVKAALGPSDGTIGGKSLGPRELADDARDACRESAEA